MYRFLSFSVFWCWGHTLFVTKPNTCQHRSPVVHQFTVCWFFCPYLALAKYFSYVVNLLISFRYFISNQMFLVTTNFWKQVPSSFFCKNSCWFADLTKSVFLSIPQVPCLPGWWHWLFVSKKNHGSNIVLQSISSNIVFLSFRTDPWKQKLWGL